MESSSCSKDWPPANPSSSITQSKEEQIVRAAETTSHQAIKRHEQKLQM
jgi:hypothetical protein